MKSALSPAARATLLATTRATRPRRPAARERVARFEDDDVPDYVIGGGSRLPPE
jgi:hypothetical protein